MKQAKKHAQRHGGHHILFEILETERRLVMRQNDAHRMEKIDAIFEQEEAALEHLRSLLGVIRIWSKVNILLQ